MLEELRLVIDHDDTMTVSNSIVYIHTSGHLSWLTYQNLRACCAVAVILRSTPSILQISLIHVPHKKRKPLHHPNMINNTNMLINRMNIPQSRLSSRIIPWSKPEDMAGQIPIIPGISISSRRARRHDDIFPIDCPGRGREDTVGAVLVGVGGCYGRYAEGRFGGPEGDAAGFFFRAVEGVES